MVLNVDFKVVTSVSDIYIYIFLIVMTISGLKMLFIEMSKAGMCLYHFRWGCDIKFYTCTLVLLGRGGSSGYFLVLY